MDHGGQSSLEQQATQVAERAATIGAAIKVAGSGGRGGAFAVQRGRRNVIHQQHYMWNPGNRALFAGNLLTLLVRTLRKAKM